MLSTLKRLAGFVVPGSYPNTKLYLAVIPLILLASVYQHIAKLDVNAIASYLLWNVVAVAITAAVLVVLQRIHRQISKSRTLGLGFVIITGVALGTSKWFSTAWLVTMAGLELDLGTALLDRITTPLLGIWAAITISVTVAAKSQLEKVRADQLQLRLAQSQGLPDQKSIQELRQFLQESINTIGNQAGSSPAQSSAMIRELVDLKLRPLSHRILRQLPSKKQRTLQSLVQNAIVHEAYPAAIAALVYLLSILPIALGERAVQTTIGLVIVQSALVWAVFSMANRLKTKLKISASGSLIFHSAVSLVAGLAVLQAAWLVEPTMDLANYLIGVLITGLWLGTLLLGAGALKLAILTVWTHEDFLTRTLDNQLEIEAKNLLEQRANQELAKYIHGRVQNRLLAKTFSPTEQSEQELLAELQELLDAVGELGPTPEQLAPAQQLTQLAAQWSPLMRISISKSLESSPRLSSNLIDVIEEAVGNAFRHGAATEVVIDLTETSAGFQLEISDNGLGPRSGESGMGSSLFSATGAWELGPGADGGSILKVALS